MPITAAQFKQQLVSTGHVSNVQVSEPISLTLADGVLPPDVKIVKCDLGSFQISNTACTSFTINGGSIASLIISAETTFQKVDISKCEIGVIEILEGDCGVFTMDSTFAATRVIFQNATLVGKLAGSFDSIRLSSVFGAKFELIDIIANSILGTSLQSFELILKNINAGTVSLNFDSNANFKLTNLIQGQFTLGANYSQTSLNLTGPVPSAALNT